MCEFILGYVGKIFILIFFYFNKSLKIKKGCPVQGGGIWFVVPTVPKQDSV